MTTTTVFDKTNKNYSLNSLMFLDPSGGMSIARYDKVKYKVFNTLAKKQRGFFWQPDEVSLLRDIKEFKNLTPHEQHIFTSNLKRQILLDSIQGRAPVMFNEVCSIPELENWIVHLTFSEQIHSESYTHIIKNIYARPDEEFNDIMDSKEIMDCADDISKYYDAFKKEIVKKQYSELFGLKYTKKDEYQLKKALWMAVNTINALEGVRFYVSFACSWAFAELKKMEGNAKIIKFIARDENIHLESTQHLLKLMPKDDPDFAKIAKECKDDALKLFTDVVEQEKEWADYLFKDGSMIGLNAEILKDYVEYIAHKRLKAINIESPYKGGSNPLPWTQKWISGGNVQIANQETETTDYIIGDIEKDISDDSFSDIEL